MAGQRIDQPEFGRRLRQRRLARGLSQRKAAGDVVAPSYISLLEGGTRTPTFEVVLHLARVLDVPVHELAGDTSYPDTMPASVNRSGHHPALAQVFARSSMEVGDYPQARAQLENAFAEAKADGFESRLVEIGLALQDLLESMAEDAPRLELIRELRELPYVHAELSIVLQTDQCSAQRELGDLGEARTVALAALAQIERSTLNHTSEHARLLGVWISILGDSGELDRAEPVAEELLTITRKLDSPGLAGRAHWVASVLQARLGRVSAARDHLEQARSALTLANTPFRDWLRFSRAAASVLLDTEADPEHVWEHLTRAETALSMLKVPSEHNLVRALRGRYELSTGNPGRAEEICRELSGPDGALSGFERARIQLTHAEALRQLDRSGDASRVLRETAHECERIGAYRLEAQAWKQLDSLRDDPR